MFVRHIVYTRICRRQ